MSKNIVPQVFKNDEFGTIRALRDGDGEVVSDCDLLDATRVTYLHHVACPDCGTRLRVEHELVPRFYASKEESNGTD